MGKIKKYLLIFIFIFSISKADPLMPFLDIKAGGMSGAFTALADNVSAIYYNPAGLISTTGKNFRMYALYGGNSVSLNDSKGSSEENAIKFFLGSAVVSENSGFSAAFFSERVIVARAKVKKYIRGDIISENIIIGKGQLSSAVSVAKRIYRSKSNKFLISGGLSFGTTFMTDSETSELELLFPWIGGGIKSKLYENEHFGIFAGVSGRKFTSLDPQSEKLNTLYYSIKNEILKSYNSETITSLGLTDLIYLSSELNRGIAISFYTSKMLITISYDNKTINYDKLRGDLNIYDIIYKVNSIGIELATPKIQLWGGLYLSKPENYSHGALEGYNTKGFTLGLGLGGVFGISYEKRIIERGSKWNFHLVSLSINPWRLY